MGTENLIEITPNLFLAESQAGFRKLLKRFNCYGSDQCYNYSVNQITKDPDAFEEVEYGMVELSSISHSKDYPIKYPCLISVDDKHFEQSTIFLFIRYLKSDTVLNELE